MSAPRAVVPVPLLGADALPLTGPLRSALSGAGPAVAPHAAGTAPARTATAPLTAGEDDPTDPTAAVVTTTGSTGAPRAVLLQASALLASAAAAHDRLGGSGGWLLAVPAHTVAGVMVAVRSLVAGTTPTVLDLTSGFDAAAFAAAAGRLDARHRRYTSLVPTQLRRLLDAAGTDGERARGALARFDAVLVGGAALDPTTRERAEAAGVAVVETYGMTETCGGCVYDGVALPGVSVALDGPDGRVLVTGPVVARGYRGPTPPEAGDGSAAGGFGPATRSFRTSDRGTWQDGRLRVLGRLDDVVVCGGVNVALDAVTRTARAVSGVADALAVGVPDPAWGSVVGVLVVPAGAAPARPGPAPAGVPARVVEAVRAAHGRAATPHHVRLVGALPLSGVGKPDRAAATRLLAGTGDPTVDRSDPEAAGGRAMGDHGGPAGPEQQEAEQP